MLYIRSAQTFTTGFTTSLISGVTYSSSNGLGYSGDIASAGIKNMLTNTASSMTSSFTTASLTHTNAGAKLLGFNNGQTADVGTFNYLTGSLAGQGLSYAMGEDFTLNLLNLSQLSNGTYSSGLLELHFSRDGTTMNLGTGGADTSFGTLASALNGINVLNVNSKINSYVKDEENEFKSAIALRIQYGYGDDLQVNQLWDILKRDVLLKVGSENFIAQTTIDENEKRVVTFGDFQVGMDVSNMSVAEQMLLGTILGHEAYRDGYKIGDIDSYGNIVTKTSNFNELVNASIARLAMSDRINEEHNWFYNYNVDFELERYILEEAIKSGDFSLYEDYVALTYNNEGDYFFPRTSTNGNYQNGNEAWRNIPLFDDLPMEEVNKINEQRMQDAYERYILYCDENNEEIKSIDVFSNDKGLYSDYGYNELKAISLYLHGCKFMSTKYLLETLTGLNYDTVDLHNSVKEDKQFSRMSDLSTQNVVDILNSRSNDIFNVSIVARDSNMTITEQLYQMNQSEDMYLAIVRVKSASEGTHFAAVDSIDFKYATGGNMMVIDQINVANPWNGTTTTGKQNYSMSDVQRWELFKVTPRY